MPGAQARNLPALRQICGASLLAAIWKVSRKKMPPLALGNAILPAETSPQEAEGCLSF